MRYVFLALVTSFVGGYLGAWLARRDPVIVVDAEPDILRDAAQYDDVYGMDDGRVYGHRIPDGKLCELTGQTKADVMRSFAEIAAQIKH